MTEGAGYETRDSEAQQANREDGCERASLTRSSLLAWLVGRLSFASLGCDKARHPIGKAFSSMEMMRK